MLTQARLTELLHFSEPNFSVLGTAIAEHGDYTIETLRLRVGDAETRGLLTRPASVADPLPAILYAHSHGGKYDIGAQELLDGREYLQEPLGPVLARAGYVTLAVDMPVFGVRSSTSEAAASKALLWKGKSLIGQMVCEQAAALSYLAARPDVDASRLGAFGMSMGCTLSYWLAALDNRVKAVAQLCCFADQRTMIELGAHDGHGIYMVVPGLLQEADAGSIAALIAPRPQLVCIGEADRLTPPQAFSRAWQELLPAYASAPTNLKLIAEPGVGHEETPRMRQAMLAYFREHL